MSYVLDANAWSDTLKGRGRIGRKLSVIPVVRIFLATPVLYELRRGQLAGPRSAGLKAALDRLATHYPAAALDTPAAEAAASIFAARKKAGRPMQHLDALIAGIALSLSATVVTRDADFAGIAGLKVEDWS